MTDLRRLLNPNMTGSVSAWPVTVEFFKTYEPQKRAALHAHEMMSVKGIVTDRRFRAAYKLAAQRNGFGKQLVCEQVDLSDIVGTARKAGYCAKYAAKSADALPDVRRINAATGEISTGGLRAWSASRGWGLSMRQINGRRRAWAESASATAVASELPLGGAAALDLKQEIYAGLEGTDLIAALKRRLLELHGA